MNIAGVITYTLSFLVAVCIGYRMGFQECKQQIAGKMLNDAASAINDLAKFMDAEMKKKAEEERKNEQPLS